jgi:H/ACA ribonucleoprotein complex subunit 4
MTVRPPFPPGIQARLSEGAFLLVDKPRGPSSHQVSAWARDILGLEKAGHAGTLDPNVSGLLWVGVGPALKLLPLMLDFPKRYIGYVAFHGAVTDAALAAALKEFTGPVYQTPPVRSAVKRERRIRTIHHLERIEGDHLHALLDVTADSGTYIRTLAVDLGEALGVGGHLEELRRTGTGPFREAGSIQLTTLGDAAVSAREGNEAPLNALLHPMEEVWREFPVLRLKDAAASAVVHGADLAAGGIQSSSRYFSAGAHVVMVSSSGTLLAFGTALKDSGEFAATRHGWVVDSERVLADSAKFPPRWGTKPAARKPPVDDPQD